jgi:hypothetical protein
VPDRDRGAALIVDLTLDVDDPDLSGSTICSFLMRLWR